MENQSSPVPLIAQKRSLLRRCFEATLATLSPAQLLRQHLLMRDGTLWVNRLGRAFTPNESRVLVSIGKAAWPLTNACLHIAEGDGHRVFEQIVVCGPEPPGGEPHDLRLRSFAGGHPTPDAISFRAGRGLLQILERLRPPASVLFLISGGGSAMLESPLDGLLSEQAMIETHHALVRGGLPIQEMNVIRKHLSAVKGGRLLQALYPGVTSTSLILSDVPEGDWDCVSSGPTTPDRSTVDDCYRIVRERRLELAPQAMGLIEDRALPETPKPGNPIFARAAYQVLADNARACDILSQQLRQAGFQVVVDHTADEWEERRAASYLLRRIRALKHDHEPSALVAGGEVLVRVPKDGAGQGGRNQAFALDLAMRISGSDLCVLSAGTDGVDGNSPAAGAIVDGDTVDRALDWGMEPRDHFESFDAYPLLQATGDTIETGPTGTNLRDLRVLL